MSLGTILILIVLAGYVSNWLNWRYLNYRLTHYLYYIGAFVHESSHALLCLLTFAKIEEFVVFSEQPHVAYHKSKIPFIGNMLISSAPVFGGLLFLFLLNHFVFGSFFTPVVPDADTRSILMAPLSLLLQLDVFHWQSYAMLLLLLNVGAMIGPSIQDMKNMWFLLILLFFVEIPEFMTFGLVALGLILANILLQILLIFTIWFGGRCIARIRG
ncbi:MAG TPA: hypothetical protein VJ579_00385 [Candidatus Paceibacterota bacterium]|nr:hypothetical protein [Candidatus Paceibacterota bacterium]